MMQSGRFADFDSMNSLKIVNKIVNKAEDLPNKNVSYNDVTKRANTSRNAL